jgi:hypothetical protein
VPVFLRQYSLFLNLDSCTSFIFYRFIWTLTYDDPLNERRIANAIRVLAMDAVQQANSGHPGAPMGMADIADVVWREFLNHNPAILNGRTATVLYCQMVMVQCCNMHCYI